jgi:hypothetical protein
MLAALDMFSLHHPMEALRSANKCNTIPEKQHNLLNNKAENNTIMKFLLRK